MAERGPDGKFLPKDQEHWQPDEENVTGELEDDGSVATVDTDAEIRRLEAQVSELQGQVDDLMPTKSIEDFLFDTPAQVEEFFGSKNLDEKVKHQIAIENKKRTRDGFDRITYTDEEFAEKRAQYIASILKDREASRPPDEGWLDRTLKMIKPATEDRERELVQIPYEGQINNVAGSLADGYIRYERKGFKRTEPMLCPAKDCWRPAASENGQWKYVGYCSEDHLNRTEKGRQDGIGV